MSRQSSAEALRSYRNRASPAPLPARRPETASPGYWGGAPTGTYDTWRRPPTTGGGYAPRGPGLWDAVLAGTLLNMITSSTGDAGWFAQHRQDPGYAEWRAQQDAKAQTDPALAEKLRQLDQRMAPVEQREGAAQPAQASKGGGLSWLVLFVLVAGFLLLWLARRRRGQGGVGGGGSPVTHGAQAGPNPFRRGMVLTLDPSPFLLGGNALGIRPPETANTSVAAVSQLRAGDLVLWRLYLPDGNTFLQLHLDRSGTPDECRWFSKLDEVTPGNADEWGFWLEPGNGAIGWPVFQAKDGQEYARAWTPGQSWVPPQALAERIDAPEGLVQRRITCMLYARPTGAAEPGPPTKYLLVAAVEQVQQAWIDLHVGIDINPASLDLPIAADRRTGVLA